MTRRNPPAKWVLPETVNPSGRVCFEINVPDDPQHIAAFRGALYSLTSARFWQDDLSHTAKDVAKVWQDVYDRIGVCAVDCDSLLACLDNVFVSSDGKLYKRDLATGLFSPVTTGAGSPPDFRTNGQAVGKWVTVPSGQTGQCLAAANISSALHQYIDNTTAGMILGAGFLSLVANANAFVIAICPPLAAIDIGTAQFISICLGFGVAAINTAMTSTVYDDFNCALYCHCEDDGSFTQDDFDGAKTQIDGATSGIATALIDSFMEQLGHNGLTVAGNAANIVTSDCTECGCSFTHLFDFTTGAHGFVAGIQGGQAVAIYEPSGWRSHPTNYYKHVIEIISPVFSSRNITGITITIDAPMTGDVRQFYASMPIDGSAWSGYVNGSTDSTHHFSVSAVSGAVIRMQIEDSGDPAIRTPRRLISASVSGNGVDPF